MSKFSEEKPVFSYIKHKVSKEELFISTGSLEVHDFSIYF